MDLGYLARQTQRAGILYARAPFGPRTSGLVRATAPCRRPTAKGGCQPCLLTGMRRLRGILSKSVPLPTAPAFGRLIRADPMDGGTGSLGWMDVPWTPWCWPRLLVWSH